MKSNEGNINNYVVIIITAISGLLVTLVVVMVWLVNNEFGAENQLIDARTKLSKLQQTSKRADTELSRLRARFQQAGAVQDAARLTVDKGKGDLLAKIMSAETEAGRAQKAAEVAQGELRHVIEQSRKVEENLKAQLAKAEKEKAEAEAQNRDGQEAADIAILKKQLSATLKQLTACNAELLTLRLVASEKQETPVTTPPPIPAPATPLSSPSVRQPIIKSVFGQVKAVEAENQFVVIQLNTTESVLAGDALAVTRQGIPVGILKVYRVGPQGVAFTALTPDLRDKVRVGDQVNLQK